MSNYNPNQATRVFSVTPAPSGQNTSKEIWEGFLTPEIDAIDIVNERTNKLIGTIGGSSYYKFNELPKSYVAQTIPDSDILGDVIAVSGGGLPNNSSYIRLSNGNLASIANSYNSTKSGIFIYDAYDVETIDPNNGYWLAYKVSDTDPNVLEKIAELKQTDDYFSNGWSYSYISQTNENECKFINYVQPLADNSALSSTVTTLNIIKTGSNYSLIASETTFNFGTTLALYNSNAPIPIAPGTAFWQYRNPYYSLQNDYGAMMTGVEEGWVWYGDGTSSTNLFTYIAGFNILTGQTAFIEPINSLSATTNFNASGIVDATYFNNWQNPPSGVVFFVYNKQILNHENNTNSVTALYSPRWENNNLVTFINQRDPISGLFDSVNGDIFNNATGFISSSTYYAFDNQYFYLFGLNSSSGYTLFISRFKLDSVVKKQEIKNIPTATSYSNGTYVSYLDIENGMLIELRNPEFNSTFGLTTFSRYYYVYWVNTSENLNRLMNNGTYTTNVIGNKFYSSANGLLYNTCSLGIEYDSYSSIQNTLNS